MDAQRMVETSRLVYVGVYVAAFFAF